MMAGNPKVCFTVMDDCFIKEGDWALNIKSVVCLGRLETVTDSDKILETCQMLARKFFPTEEAVEEEIAKSLDRVNVFAMTIDRMTGKLVNES